VPGSSQQCSISTVLGRALSAGDLPVSSSSVDEDGAPNRRSACSATRRKRIVNDGAVPVFETGRTTQPRPNDLTEFIE
jgi:hypothetical protein